jgi:hypothetical protein
VRALLTIAALLASTAATAATPLALAERQVVTLEFARPVARLATTEPDLLGVEPSGQRVKVTALRGGRAQLDVAFDDGASVTFDVTVSPLHRPGAAAAVAQGGVALSVGEQRRLPAPGLARALLEENGVAQVQAEAAAVVVTGLTPGRASLVLVDQAGRRTTVELTVRP